MQQDSLLAPGPVNLHPEVRRILALPMIHHRTPEFDAVLKRVLEDLKSVFGTRERVYIHSSTGTGGMESLLVNTLSPGDEVIAVVSGKFGERWAEMARVFGMKVHVLNVPWGEAVKPDDVAQALKQNPRTRAVLCQACETSTGVLHPVQELAAITKNLPDTLLLIDGITAVGALPLPMDEWGIDGLVAGSQKAFMLPTGMSFVSFSAKAWRFVENAKSIRYYFDIREEKKANERGETWFSSSVPLIRALDWVLQDLKRQGLPTLYQSIQRRAEMTRHFARIAGLELYAKAPSPSLTAIKMPEGIDGQKLRTQLEADHRITVMGGQDQAKGKILRVGHMGFIQDEEMQRLFDSLMKLLQKLQPAQWPNEKIDEYSANMRAWMGLHP